MTSRQGFPSDDLEDSHFFAHPYNRVNLTPSEAHQRFRSDAAGGEVVSQHHGAAAEHFAVFLPLSADGRHDVSVRHPPDHRRATSTASAPVEPRASRCPAGPTPSRLSGPPPCRSASRRRSRAVPPPRPACRAPDQRVLHRIRMSRMAVRACGAPGRSQGAFLRPDRSPRRGQQVAVSREHPGQAVQRIHLPDRDPVGIRIFRAAAGWMVMPSSSGPAWLPSGSPLFRRVVIACSSMKWPPAGMADRKSGGSKPQTDGGRIPLAGVVLAALPTQAARRLHLHNAQAQKTHRVVGGGYRS